MFDLIFSIFFTLICIFIIDFYLINLIYYNSIHDILYNKESLYIALIAAFNSVLVNVLIYNIYNPNMNKYIYIPIVLPIIILLIIYRFQIFITDNDYLKSLIEINSNILLVSNSIKDKTKNKEVKELANKIIDINKNNIEHIKNIIKYNQTIYNITKS